MKSLILAKSTNLWHEIIRESKLVTLSNSKLFHFNHENISKFDDYFEYKSLMNLK